MESVARVNGVELAYETFGDPADPTVLLIMGLGVQMLGWDEGFCRMRVERGFHVVRFDNRDVGHSTKIEGGPRPDVMAAVAGDGSSASYLLDDMADDCVGLLDELEVDAAHLVGACGEFREGDGADGHLGRQLVGVDPLAQDHDVGVQQTLLMLSGHTGHPTAGRR